MKKTELPSLFVNAPPGMNTSGNLDEYLFGMISRRAYELFEERGRHHGHEWEDWLEAERQIKHHLGIRQPE